MHALAAVHGQLFVGHEPNCAFTLSRKGQTVQLVRVHEQLTQHYFEFIEATPLERESIAAPSERALGQILPL